MKKIPSKPHKNGEDEGGAIAVMVAVVATLLIVCLAFAIDMGYAWQVKRSMVKSTDAAALAAAQKATDIKNLSVRGACPTSVKDQAVSYLNANTTAPTLDFCQMAGISTTPSNASQSSGIVTVRAKQTATFSFSKLFGLNSRDVYSSTTARWNDAPLLPIVGCANKGNSSDTNNKGVSDWFANKSANRSPLKVTSDWSGSTNATLCSGGASGGYGIIDLASSPTGTGSSEFSKCNSSNAAYQTALKSSIANWLASGYPATVKDGAYKCAAVGQLYGAAIDKAICQARGKEVAIPIVDDLKAKNDSSSGKDWIIHISGFALVTIDNYTTGTNQDKCSTLAAGKPANRKAQFRLTSTRKMATVGDLSISTTPTWPSSVVINTPTVLTIEAYNASTITVTDAKFTITLSSNNGAPTVPLPSAPSDCKSDSIGANTVVFTCKVVPKSWASNTTATQSFTFTAVSTTPVSVSVRLSAGQINESVPENNERLATIYVTSQPTTTTSATTTTTTTTTVPPTTTTVAPVGDFSRLVMTYLRTATDKSSCCKGLNELYSYRICAVNIATAAAALSPAACLDYLGQNCHDSDDNERCDEEEDDSNALRGSSRDSDKPLQLIKSSSKHRSAPKHSGSRITHGRTPNNRVERILP